MRNNKYKTVAIPALICCLLWGSAFPAVKKGYILFNIKTGETSNQILFAGLRFTIAGLLVLMFCKLVNGHSLKVKKIKKNELFLVLLVCLFQTILQYVFFYIGLSNTTGVIGSILTSASTFMTVIISHYVYENDKLNISKLMGTFLGFIGVLIVILNGSNGNLNFKFLGEGFMLLAALCSALGAVVSKKAAQNIDPVVLTGFQLFLGGLFLVITSISFGAQLNSVSYRGIALLLYLAFLSATAFSIWTYLLKNNKVSEVSIYNFSVPIFGSILSSLFLGEGIFSIRIFISLVFVSIGIYIVNRYS